MEMNSYQGDPSRQDLWTRYVRGCEFQETAQDFVAILCCAHVTDLEQNMVVFGWELRKFLQKRQPCCGQVVRFDFEDLLILSANKVND
jgi:hypothetical protein